MAVVSRVGQRHLADHLTRHIAVVGKAAGLLLVDDEPHALQDIQARPRGGSLLLGQLFLQPEEAGIRRVDAVAQHVQIGARRPVGTVDLDGGHAGHAQFLSCRGAGRAGLRGIVVGDRHDPDAGRMAFFHQLFGAEVAVVAVEGMHVQVDVMIHFGSPLRRTGYVYRLFT